MASSLHDPGRFTRPGLRSNAQRAVVGIALAYFVAACGESVSPPAPVSRGIPTIPSFAVDTAPNGDGVCMGDDTFAFGKTSAASATDLNCTANDIEIATATIQQYSFTGLPGSFQPPPAEGIDCLPNQTIFVDIKASLRNNAQSRYDIGVWVESDPNNPTVEMHGDKGAVVLSKAVTGACTHYNLVVGRTGVSSLETPDALKDACGDMAEGSGLAELDLDVIQVTCTDADQNGKVEVSNCIGWQNVDGDETRVCPSPGTAQTFRFGTTPNNKAKCNCTPMQLNINIAASLDIEKVSIGGTETFDYTVSGAPLVPFNRTTTTAGVPTATAPVVINSANFGDKYVTESAKSGWTLTNISCTANGAVIAIGTGQDGAFSQGTSAGFDAGDNTVKVTVGSADTPSCTFENTKDASVDIEKISLGGTAEFDYTVSGAPLAPFTRTTTTAGVATTTAPVTVTPANFGTKYVTETAETGYTLTNISCTANGADIEIGTGQGAGFNAGAGAGFSAGETSVKITVDAGDTPSCTFTNTKDASIDIEKISLGGTAEFDYTVSGAPLAPFTRTTTTAGVATTTAPVTVTAANFGTKYVTETAETGYTLTNISCTANGADIEIGTGQGAGFNAGAGAGFSAGETSVKITVDAGDTPTCTFENTLGASLDIEKQSIGGAAEFDYTVSGAPLNAFTRNTAGSNPTATAAVSISPADFGIKYVTETAETGFTLTAINCTANGAVITIGTGQGGAFNEGASAGFDAGDNTVKVDVGAGDNPTCTFVNTAFASLDIEKESVGGTETFDYTVSGTGLSPFTRNTGTTNPTTSAPFEFTGAQVENVKYVTESAETGYALTAINCTANGAVIAIGTGQGGSFAQGTSAGFDAGDNTVKVTLTAGDSPTCTFVNTKLAKVQVIKTLSGNPITGSETFSFTLRTGASATEVGTTLESLVANSTNGGTLNFTTFLTPGSTYQICEVVFAGWSSSISGLPGSFVIQTEPDGDNSTICVAFTPTAGQLVEISINNTPPPGGDARTIGYWKNWNSCSKSNGKQADKLGAALAAAGGSILIGDLVVDTCAEAVAILNKSTINAGNKKMASDPAYNLAAQLLAARLNVAAGAASCPEADAAMLAGQNLLAAADFDGTGGYKSKIDGAAANSYAAILDDYNNNQLCS